MRASFIQEPELEFGTSTHIDIRFGLLNDGPLDSSSPGGPKRVRLGIVGTPESVAGLSSGSTDAVKESLQSIANAQTCFHVSPVRTRWGNAVGYCS